MPVLGRPGASTDWCFVCAAYNFDQPSAFDSKAIVNCLQSLQRMQQVDVPIYDFVTHQQSSETRRVEPADVVIIEGIMVLHMAEVRNMLNMKIYVDTDDDVRLARRRVLTFVCYHNHTVPNLHDREVALTSIKLTRSQLTRQTEQYRAV